MKIIGVALFVVYFAVTSDAAALGTSGLPNGGYIVTPYGQYIPGELDSSYI